MKENYALNAGLIKTGVILGYRIIGFEFNV
jgi:hypothetical protein